MLLKKLLIACVLAGWFGKGMCVVQRDFQVWPNITAIGKLNQESFGSGRLSVWLEAQQRFGDDSSKVTQILFRPALGYALTTNLSLWFGYGWIRTSVPLTTHPFGENRIWQQLLWVKKNPSITFTSRTRLEQRHFQRHVNNFRVGRRARQLIKLAIPFRVDSKYSLISSEELFWNKDNYINRNGKGFDQNRFFIGLGYEINGKLNAEIGYMNQYIRRVGPDFLANLFSINLFINF